MSIILIPITIIGFLTFTIYFLSYEVYQKKMASWREFAEANQLNFNADSFGGEEAYINGIYKDNALKLEMVIKYSGNTSKIYTRLRLITLHRPLQELTLTQQQISELHIRLKDMLQALNPTEANPTWRGFFGADTGGFELWYEQLDIESNVAYLQSTLDHLCTLIEIYPTLVAAGSELMPMLESLAANKKNKLRPLIRRLIEDIAADTSQRLGGQAQHLLCPRCWTCCAAHNIHRDLGQDDVTYYGCRTCGQSQHFFEGWVVALLDSKTNHIQSEQEGIHYINWLTRQSMFDFDEVQIRHANDEMVEHFAVQIGNDTDPMRRMRYKNMRCVISPTCALSENTLRILGRMLGPVEVMALSTEQKPSQKM